MEASVVPATSATVTSLLPYSEYCFEGMKFWIGIESTKTCTLNVYLLYYRIEITVKALGSSQAVTAVVLLALDLAL